MVLGNLEDSTQINNDDVNPLYPNSETISKVLA